MQTPRTPKTARRVGRAAPGILAGLLVTALLGLTEPAANPSTAEAVATSATASTATPTQAPTPVAWRTTSEHDHDHDHDEHDEKKQDEDQRDNKKRDDEKNDKRDGRKDDAPERGNRDRGNNEDRAGRDGRPTEEDDREKRDESETDKPGGALPTVGQLMADSVERCSGTVIESTTHRLVLTAAQCVYSARIDSDLSGKAPGWTNEELTFVPGRAGDDTPHGEWVVDGMWVPPEWIETSDAGDPDPRFDVAVLTVATRDGKTIQDVVGAQRVDFTAGEQSDLTAIGYPAASPFNGTAQNRCTEPGNVPLKDRLYSMPCNMTDGVGGAAWFADLDRNGLGTIVAVSSGLSTDGTQMFGTPLGGAARGLIESADTDAANRDEREDDQRGDDKNDKNDKNDDKNRDDKNRGGREIEI